MIAMYGEELPFIALDAAYYYEWDETSKVVMIADETETNYIALGDYGHALLDAGFTLDGIDNSQGYEIATYSKVLDETNKLVVEIDFYPGDDTYYPGNEIYAYIDDGTTSGVQTTDTSWPEDLSNAMIAMYGEELPFIALDAAYYYKFDETTKKLLIGDDTETNYLTQENYGQSLLDAGFTLEELDNSQGYDVITYTKALDENYQLIVTTDFYPGDETTPSGNEIYAYVDEIIHPVTSTTWPSEQIDTLLGATYNIPSFIVNGDYTYYTYAGGLYITGVVDVDITEAYEAQAKENGLLVGVGIDYSSLEAYYYIYNWEENFMISYGFNQEDSSFSIYILPSQPAYDSLVDTFPADQIVSLLGEGKTEVPAFDCIEGSNYKVKMVEEDPEYGLTAYFMITAIDNGTIGTDSIEDKYLAILETAGWTVDASDYDNSGYIATTENNDVCLTFYTIDGLFYLYVEDASSITANGVFDLSTSDAQATINTSTQVVYTSGQYTVTIDKGTSQVATNNYLGNGVDHHETRVYRGQTLTIETTEGTLGAVVIEFSSTADVTAFSGCTLTNCTATVDGTTVILTPSEGATNVTIDTSGLSEKRLNLIGISIL